MSYTRSAARKAFDSEIDRIVRELKSVGKRKGLKSNIKTHVECSCIILSMAQIENYLEDVLITWINGLNAIVTTPAGLPVNMRAFYMQDDAFRKAVANYMINGDEDKYIKAMQDFMARPVHQMYNNTAALPRIYPQQLINDKKYPSPKNFKRLFFRIGIRNIFGEIDRRTRKDSEKALQSFNDLRTAIAHQGTPPGINYNDIAGKIKEIQAVINTVDRILHRHVLTHGGSTCWRS
ncbi:HEPN domain-containing protein [Deinococcus sp. RIT780]|uniref:HEPN domain-containing protein n=1 Tax=Deinococcus sp. RIT780 TaxID=2870472 RepID=UPI001C8A2CC9|nr:HEPN domain-containing protein [Deinococcus sp. RIT780]MBX8465004.1 hypothetical protein [Deinococcus sp. RIT780]